MPTHPTLRFLLKGNLAARHFAAATFYLVAGAAGLVWIAPELAAGMYASPHVAGVTHLFTLGWLSTTIFGALCQLLPAAFGAPLGWPRLGVAAFWSFATGAGVFACGVATGVTAVHHFGIALVATGISLALMNIVSALHRAKTRDVTWAAIALAAGFLTTTFAIGVVLLHNLHTGMLGAARVRVLATHLHVAIVGWALIMMVGISHRLLPMVLTAPGVRAVWSKWAVAALACGVVVLGVGISASMTVMAWAGAMLLEAGIACFIWQTLAFYRARMRRRVDVGVRFVLVAQAYLALAGGLGASVMWLGAGATRLATTYVLVGLLGGVVLFVIGFFYKIVPMLAWTLRYRGSTEGAPPVSDTYSTFVALLQLGVMGPAPAVLGVAIVAGSTMGVYAGALLFLAGAALFAGQIVYVAFGRPVTTVGLQHSARLTTAVGR
jgi:hypothetical protein